MVVYLKEVKFQMSRINIKIERRKYCIFILLLFCILVISKCVKPDKGTPTIIDDNGRVLESVTGDLVKGYDTLGNMIYMRGYVDYDDWNSCVNDIIFRDEKGKRIRRILYSFNEKDSLPCIVRDSANYLEYKYIYNEFGKLERQETYSPILLDGKVTGYKLTSTNKRSND